MKGNKSYFLLFISILFVSPCYAYVYQIAVMKKVDPITNHFQLVIGIGDYHDKSHPANSQQRSYLEELFKRFPLIKGKLIVEDLSSVNQDGKGMCCNYVINANGGILGKLADVARRESVDVDNVEYRYCRVAALGPLLNNPHITPKNFNSSESIAINVLGTEVCQEIEKAQKYDDGIFLNALYKRTVREITKSFNQLKFDRVKNQSVADYCAQLFTKDYVKNLEKLCIFDSALIDMKILHSIVSASDKSVILVAAGGSHIEKITTLLGYLGYQKIVAPSSTVKNYQSLESALSSDEKKNGKGPRPEAINIHILDQFIN